MLSRVAERIYWMARYLERAENTARLAKVYGELLLDLPRGVGVEWRQLITITGSDETFGSSYRTSGERNVLKFLLADPKNSNSVVSVLKSVRENVRTSRDLVPSEGWEHVNELYLYAQKKFARGNLPARLHEVLSELIMRSQQITGLLAGTMSHGNAYQFINLGRALERADMTTRIVDVGSTTLIAKGNELPRLENRLWMNVLRSLSAYQMYRQSVRRRIRGVDVVEFLLRDPLFPRSVAYNLTSIQSALDILPRSDNTKRETARILRKLAETDIDEIYQKGLHDHMDEIQIQLSEVHTKTVATWFLPRSDETL